MLNDKGHVVINNEISEPTGDYVCDYLLSQTNETAFLDFKWILDVKRDSQEFPKIIKDVYAFSNYGGGWLLLGVKENNHVDPKIKGKFVKTGLPNNFEIEDASLQEKINSYLDKPISIKFRQFSRTIDKEERKFALVYFQPSSEMMIPKNDIKYSAGDKEKIAVRKDVVYTRRGTQSITASNYEKELIRKRLTKEEYRLSILSGEPEEIQEIIFSNLFEVKSIPNKVYVGTAKHRSFEERIRTLRLAYPGQRYFSLKYRIYKDKIVTFGDLENLRDIHSALVWPNEIQQESVTDWLGDPDKEKIIISLLNKEVTCKAKQQGMRYDGKTHRLFYPMLYGDERKEEWPTRYRGVQKKRVMKRISDPKLKQYAYLHEAVKIEIMNIGNRFYLRINPTMIITEDGKTPRIGLKEGAIITEHAYRIYNKQYLNTILFWINKLGDGNDVCVVKDFMISNEPVQTNMEIGITWDIPTTDFKKFIMEFDAELASANEEDAGLEELGDENHDF